MSETICAEAALAGASLALGAGLMAIYDGIRIWRVLIPHESLWTGLEDLIYWMFSAVSTFLLLFYQNDGILRWYAVTGVLFGMLLYRETIGRFVWRVLKKAEKYLTIKRKERMRQAKLRRLERHRKNGDRKDDGKTVKKREREGKEKEKREFK